MRFMCVGDSMTIGRAGDFTWRYRLWQHLEAVPDGPHTLVGPRTELYDAETGTASSSAYAADFPPAARRHLAGWGEGWLHMAPVIAETVTAHRPDILLVSLGLIDLGFYTDSGQTTENVRTFLTAAREANPHIRAVLLPVIPNVRAETDAPFATECARFNELLAKAVADLDTPGSPSSWPRTPRRTTSTPTRTTAPTRAPQANTTWPRPSPTRCTRRGAWAGHTRVRRNARWQRPPEPAETSRKGGRRNGGPRIASGAAVPHGRPLHAAARSPAPRIRSASFSHTTPAMIRPSQPDWARVRLSSKKTGPRAAAPAAPMPAQTA